MCVRTAEYPLSTSTPWLPSGFSAPLTRLAVAHRVCCEYATYPTGVPARCAVPTSHRGTAGLPLVDARAACGMQADGQFGYGGLVSIVGDNNHVSVVGSTLTNINVRAHCSVPAECPAHRGSRPAAPNRWRAVQCHTCAAHRALLLCRAVAMMHCAGRWLHGLAAGIGYRRIPLVDAGASLRRVRCAGQSWRARGYPRRK
jgi:hypothetical protein